MEFDFQKPFTFDRVVRILITIGLFAALFFLLKTLQNALIPFAIALLVAYLLDPLVEFLRVKARLKHRVTSVIAALLIVAVLFTGLIMILTPLIKSEVQTMGVLLSAYAEDHASDIPYLPENLNAFFKEQAKKINIEEYLNGDSLSTIAGGVLTPFMTVFSGSMKVLASLFGIITIILYLVFILLDYNKLTGNWENLIPVQYRSPIVTLFTDLKDGMNTYFRAQAIVAAIVGVLFAIGFGIIGLPLGVLLGLFIGLLNMVPYLQLAGLIPALFCAVLQSLETGTPLWIVLLMVLGVFVVVQAIQEIILVPKIMGDVTGLNPAIILLSLSIWGSLLGILGMIIALPVSSLLLAYYKRYIAYVNRKHQEEGVPIPPISIPTGDTKNGE